MRCPRRSPPTVTVSFAVGQPSLSVTWLVPGRVIRMVIGAALLNPRGSRWRGRSPWQPLKGDHAPSQSWRSAAPSCLGQHDRGPGHGQLRWIEHRYRYSRKGLGVAGRDQCANQGECSDQWPGAHAVMT
jgi:hypothetical protein